MGRPSKGERAGWSQKHCPGISNAKGGRLLNWNSMMKDSEDTDLPDPGQHNAAKGAADRMLEEVSAHADHLLELAEHGVTDVNALTVGAQAHTGNKQNSNSKDGNERSLEEKLLELHIEESLKDKLSWSSHLNPCSNLLTLLCKRERLNKLVVTLHPESHYNLAATTADGQMIGLAQLPYSEDAVLNALDAQEVPAFLVDLLEKSVPALFYSGCVIAKVHDLRARACASSASQPDVTHLLLRPTTQQSIICDSNVMAKQLSAVHGRPLSQEERSAIEGQLALASEPHLCLDPDPVVSVMVRKRFATVPLRNRALRKHVGITRKRKLDAALNTAMPPPPDLHLHNFICARTGDAAQATVVLLRAHQEQARAVMRSSYPHPSSGLTDGLPVELDAPMETDVMRHSRALPRQDNTINSTPIVKEEYILESVYYSVGLSTVPSFGGH